MSTSGIARPTRTHSAVPTPPALPGTARTAAARRRSYPARPTLRAMPSSGSAGPSSAAGSGGASSISTCAFVPVNPNELTPARRGLPLACHGVDCVHDPHRQRVPRNVRRRGVEVQALRQHFVLQRQHDLDQTGDPRSRLEVADVGLHRSHQQRPVRVARGTVDGPGRLDLDRITQRGARAVRLEIVDVPAGEAGASQRGRDEPLLRTAIGHRQTAGSAVLVDRAAPDDRADPIAVALRVAEPLEHENSAAFTAHVAVGGGVEGLASPVGRKHPGAGRGDDGHRAQQDVHAAGQRQIAVTGVQCLTGLMDGHQRRTARGVDRHRRSFESERERDPTGDGVERVAGDEVRLDLVDRLRRTADARTRWLPRPRRRRFGCRATPPASSPALSRPSQTVSSIRRCCGSIQTASRGEMPKNSGSNPSMPSRNPPKRRVDLARRLRIGVVELVDVEAILRDLPDRVDTAGQHLPERFRVGSAGETARHRDDRDRLVGACRHCRRQLGRRSARVRFAEPEHVVEQVVGDVGQTRVVHRQGDRNLLADALFDAAPQFDGHQRIHAEVEESGVLADLRGVDARHLGHRVAQVIGQESFLRCCTGALVSRSTSWVFPVRVAAGAAAASWAGTSRSNSDSSARRPACW